MTDDSLPLGDGAAGAAAVFAKAVDLLAIRPHFRAELEAKLARKGFAAAAVTTSLDRLAALGYLDDLAAARGFAGQRVSRQGWGPRKLRAELSRRGVAEEHVNTVVDEAFVDGERAAARSVASRRLARGGGRGVDQRDKLARYLDRRGFSKAVIVEILHESAAEAGSDHEEF